MNVVVGYGNIYTRNRIVYLKKLYTYTLHYIIMKELCINLFFMYYKSYLIVFHNGFNL